MLPDGSNVTAWQKFMNIAKNALRGLMGMPPKGIESAAGRIDTLLEAVISPAPETRFGGSLLALSATGQGAKAFDAMSKVYDSLPLFNDNVKNNLSKFFEGSFASAIKSLVRSALPLNALGEVATKYIPMAKTLNDLISQRSGAESALNSEIEPVVNRAQTWASKQTNDTRDVFNDVVYTSTVNGVDPTKPRSAYLDSKGQSKMDKSGNKLVDVWDEMQPGWKALQKTGGDVVYKEMRDTYKKIYDRIGKILEMRVNDEFGGDTEKAKTANKILQKLYNERGIIEPYFPLTRRGQYWLSYNLDGADLIPK
jgi:hypothetical protein